MMHAALPPPFATRHAGAACRSRNVSERLVCSLGCFFEGGAVVDMSIGQRLGSPRQRDLPAIPAHAGGGREATSNVIHPRVQAIMVAARFHGVELDPKEIASTPAQHSPSAASLTEWARSAGLWARAVRLRWRQLMQLADAGPVVLLLTDGTATLMTGANAERDVVFLRDSRALTSEIAVAVDRLRLARVWSGEAVLLRAQRGQMETDAPFTLGFVSGLVLREKRSLRDIGLASLTLSFLTIFPPLLVMTVVDKVLTHHSYSTLVLLATILAITTLYEAVLGYARRLIVMVVGARLDAKLNLHVFNRLLRLPLDYFERHPAGETMHKIAQVNKVREFLTGKLLATFLDMMTLAVLLPFLFYLNSFLAFIVLACSVLIVLVVLAYLRPLQHAFAKVVAAEAEKAAALGETIFGVKTVKSLALEPQRRMLWDVRVAEAGKRRLAFGTLANWPQTIVNPIERFMSIGIVLVGAYIAIADKSGYAVGAAISEAASVLNRPLEYDALSRGLRPQLSGAITFEDVSFTYDGTKIPALDRVTFAVPAGTMLGIVGRSGSGKSTLTRLLQGINRDYSGFVRIDGNDVREINLRHLRQSFGVVLQENFLFRGSICDNIIAGRPGLTLSDAVRAARLAGAEEFIERLPNGYDTYVEEGSPNLSGGQTQRLAIARALIHDPRILLLDEATSALDPESEALVSANLLRIAQGRTMIIVSHRLSSLTECDQILVMDQGKLIDMAPHNVLLDRCPLYRQLWVQQNRHAESQGSHRHAGVAPRLVPGSPGA